mgnify:CR=1 FL=1
MKASELRERKRELGFSNKMISDLSGVPLSTVEKIFSGATESPRYETIRKIEDALFGEASEVLSHPSDYTNVNFNDYRVHVSESPADYAASSYYQYDDDIVINGKRQGQFTVEDCRSLPEGIRMELIDGVLYDMATPTNIHQMIVTQVSVRIAAVMDEVGGDCDLFAAPLDVQLSENYDKDCFEPDLFIICDSRKCNEKGYIVGAPDMVMEVISPSSRSKDRVLKLNKYMDNGVREYWIVDPELREIQVYYFEGGSVFSRYTFEDVVPLHIFDEKISVNFAAITRKLRDRLGFGIGK